MPAEQDRPFARGRRGVTLSETLLAAAGIGVVLALVGMGMEGIRTELKWRQAIALVRTLNSALTAYQQSTGEWPVGPGIGNRGPSPSSEGANAAPGESADPLVHSLAQVPASRTVLETVPSILRLRPESNGLTSDQDDPAGWGTVRDPWGRQLRCLTGNSPSAVERKAVAANRNRPIFISAGPDRRFGSSEVAAASDNIRSDEHGE